MTAPKKKRTRGPKATFTRRDRARIIHAVAEAGVWSGIRDRRTVKVEKTTTLEQGSCIKWSICLRPNHRSGVEPTVAEALESLAQAIHYVHPGGRPPRYAEKEAPAA